MGELAGTIIIGHIIEGSMFKILRGTENTRIGGDSGSGDLRLEAGEPLDTTTFFNLILADNLDGYVQAGGQPIATMQTVPMVDCEIGSQFSTLQCRFVGRINNGAVASRGKTLQAVGGYSTGGGTSTHLTAERCYFDGMATGISFTPGGGDIDHLTIDKCRARVFGSENAADALVLRRNCFCDMSICNATLTNNYMVAFGAFPAQLVISAFVVSSTAANDDVKVVLTGNSGGTNITTSTLLYTTEVGVTIDAIKIIQYGNSFDSAVATTWFVTVGTIDSTPLNSRPGDFLGVGAIDLVLAAGFTYPTTVIVNGGTYNITSEGSRNYNFIGNVLDSVLPIFNMTLAPGATTDEIGNRRFLCGRELRNIHFIADIGSTTVFHSIRPGQSGDEVTIVENCAFDNCTLSVSTSPNAASADGLVVNHCRFDQDGDYSDNLALLLPILDRTIVEGCNFTGSGYIGLIGNDSGITYTSLGKDVGTLVLRDCTMNMEGAVGAITDASPLTVESYLVIDDINSRVSIDNCQMVVQETLNPVLTAIAAGRVLTYLRHIFIRAQEINVNNCTLQGPAQAFTESGNPRPIPVAEFIPTMDLNITDSRFKDSVTKIGGLATAMNTNPIGNIIVTGNSFNIPNLTSILTQTLLDIELDPTSGPLQDNHGKITISDNNFQSNQSAAGGSNLPFHSLITTDYVVHGVVQIYARDFGIDFNNNTIRGVTRAPVPIVGDSTGLIIDNYSDNAGDSTQIIPIKVNNNVIMVTNLHTTAVASDNASCLFLRGTDMVVADNHLQMNNQASTSSSFIGVAVFDNRNTSGGNAPSPANVVGNTFSKATNAGALTTLNLAWMRNQSTTTGDGWICNNSFGNPTSAVGGLEPAFINQAGGTTSWVADRNKNQQVNRLIGAGTGALGYSLSGVDSIAVPQNNGAGGTVSSFIEWGDINNTLDHLKFNYLDNSPQGTVTFRWMINLEDILPHGVYIEGVTAVVDVSANNVSGSSVSTLTLRTTGGTDLNTISPLTTSGGTHSLNEDTTPGAADGDWGFNAQRVIGTSGILPALELSWAFSSTATSIFDVNQISLTYRY